MSTVPYISLFQKTLLRSMSKPGRSVQIIKDWINPHGISFALFVDGDKSQKADGRLLLGLEARKMVERNGVFTFSRSPRYPDPGSEYVITQLGRDYLESHAR